jgi:hypothetical protein
VTLIAVFILLATVGAAQARPHGGGSDNSIQFKFGVFKPSGGGEVWDDVEDTFFLHSDDFKDPVLGFTYISGIGNHLELGFNIDVYDSVVASDYRDYVDEDGFPIIHDTALSMIPISVDLRLVPTGRHSYRGRGGRIQLRKPVVYVGGGFGMNLYEYEEFGYFIDFGVDPIEVFYGEFRDSGVSFQTHALAGVELPLGGSWGLIVEGKYTWSEEELGDDFRGFGDLDLGGFTGYIGAALHF